MFRWVAAPLRIAGRVAAAPSRRNLSESPEQAFDPLELSDEEGLVDSDPFAPPGTVKTYVPAPKIPEFMAEAVEEPDAQDTGDPRHWGTDEIVGWVKEHYVDGELDRDLEEAFHIARLNGNDLFRMYPNNMYKMMRRHYRNPDWAPQ
eukprot:Sspe_Gene.52538::Locus_29098_Transcript_2_2_Confidence_0.400_Length_484::g.52538::m.52538